MTKLLLLLFSGLKFGKLLTTGGTMLLSVAVYAFAFGWRYAVGFVVLWCIIDLFLIPGMVRADREDIRRRLR